LILALPWLTYSYFNFETQLFLHHLPGNLPFIPLFKTHASIYPSRQISHVKTNAHQKGEPKRKGRTTDYYHGAIFHLELEQKSCQEIGGNLDD
jgi:hypothetical protein